MARTIREALLARATDQSAAARPALLFEDRAWTWAQAHEEALARAALLSALLSAPVSGPLPDAGPPHVGVLLDNVPDFAFLLAGAALGGHVVVGLNTTRRGQALLDDVRRSDCRVVITETAHRDLLGLDPGVPVLDVDSPEWAGLVATHRGAALPDVDVSPGDLLMLIFTSGTSGEPKAVRITHEKVAHPGQFLAERFGLGPADTAYLAMPLFHSNAVMAGWAPALSGGSTMALARRFSASAFLPDVRRFGATYANYVGKPLTYVLATPEAPDDADNPLRLVFGNEAVERDIDTFAARFGCTVVDSYSSTENAVVVQRTPDMPRGALGRPVEGVEVWHRETRTPTADAVLDADGRLVNADDAVGELVNTTGAGMFAGYYKDPAAEAERMAGGVYWSGDLAYRDAAGFVWFAGRTADWLRVDGENLAAAPVERILLRHPGVQEAAVYAVPDPQGGDHVVAALTPRPGTVLEPEGLEAFLAAQDDLSPKAWPRYVRLVTALPRTATHKVLKRALAAEGVAVEDPVWVREHRGTAYEVVHGAS